MELKKIFCISLLVMSVFAVGEGEPDKCAESISFYKNEVLPRVSPTPDSDEGHGEPLCGKSPDCCNPQMFGNLAAYSQQDLEKTVTEKASIVKTHFEINHNDFNEYFKELIGNAKASLDELFSSTYGDLYTQNSKIFMVLFDDLMQYYDGEIVDMNDIFDRFFTKLMQEVFKLLQPSYDIDDKYMQCIADNINIIQPFADLPQKMSNQVRRAFIAARTFVKGLKKGEQVAERISKIHPTKECGKDFMNMTYCQICHGHSKLKPCRYVCLNVMDRCLADLRETNFNSAWSRYIEANLKLLDRLKGPFNIESVLDPIDVKISEAVMTLQDNRRDISDTVTRQCGLMARKQNLTGLMFGFNLNGGMEPLGLIPGLSKIGQDKMPDNLEISKRSVDGSNDDADDEGKDSKRKRKRSRKRRRRRRRRGQVERENVRNIKHFRSTLMSGPSQVVPPAHQTKLELLVLKMKAIANEAKHFWKNLPHTVCAETSEKEEGESCWDGMGSTIYNRATMQHWMESQMNTQEQNSPAKIQNMAVRQEITTLYEAAANLNHAYHGVDPALVDNDDTMYPFYPKAEMDGEESAPKDEIYYDEQSGEGSGNNHNAQNNRRNMPSLSLDQVEGAHFRNLPRWQKKLVEQVLGERVAPGTSLTEISKRLEDKPSWGIEEEDEIEADPAEKPKNVRKNRKKKFRDLTKSEQEEIQKKLGRIVKPGTSLQDIEIELENKNKPAPTKNPTAVVSPTSGSRRNKSTTVIIITFTIFSYFCWTNIDRV